MQNFYFGQNFRNILKISKYFDLSQICERNSILVKIFDFFENFEKFRFELDFRSIRFWQNFWKSSILSQISILVKILAKFRFSSKFSKISIFSKISKYLYLSQIFEKISILVKIFESFNFFKNL